MINLILSILVVNLLLFLFKNKIFLKLCIIDYPDEIRKYHKNPAYLAGGLILAVNIAILLFYNFFFKINNLDIFFFYSTRHSIIFIISFFTFLIIGLYDDKYDLSPYVKLVCFFFISYILIEVDDTLVVKNISLELFKLNIQLYNFSLIFTILCIVGFINAINMFDGINLQLSLYILSILLVCFFKINNNLLVINLIIAMAFFLLLNFNGFAFLGNSGSFTIGFLIAYILLKNYNANFIFNTEQVILMLLYPVLDMLRLFIFRLYYGKNPFRADRNHLHHFFLKFFSYFKTISLIFLSYVIPFILHFAFDLNVYFCILTLVFLYISIFIFIIFKNDKIFNV